MKEKEFKEKSYVLRKTTIPQNMKKNNPLMKKEWKEKWRASCSLEIPDEGQVEFDEEEVEVDMEGELINAFE